MSCRPTDVNSDLTQAELRLLFDYDPETGMLTRRVQTSSNAAAWCQAGYTNGGGYISVGLHRRSYLAHRLIWLYVHGRWPASEIDHINGVKSDNRLCNLREATRHGNNQNARLRKDNLAGVKGVRWVARSRKWRVRIRSVHIGYFDDVNDAAEAYRVAAERQFGEFSRRA